MKDFTCHVPLDSNGEIPKMMHGDYDKFLDQSPSDDGCKSACCTYHGSGKYKGIGGAESFVQADHQPCCNGEDSEIETTLTKISGEKFDITKIFE